MNHKSFIIWIIGILLLSNYAYALSCTTEVLLYSWTGSAKTNAMDFGTTRDLASDLFNISDTSQKYIITKLEIQAADLASNGVGTGVFQLWNDSATTPLGVLTNFTAWNIDDLPNTIGNSIWRNYSAITNITVYNSSLYWIVHNGDLLSVGNAGVPDIIAGYSHQKACGTYSSAGTCSSGWGGLSAGRGNIRVWGCSAPAENSDNINISNPLPANNTQFNSATKNFNATINSTFAFNYSLWIDGAIEGATQIGGTGSNFVSFIITPTEGNHTYYFYAVQGNDSTQNETTTTNLFYKDITVPVITTNFLNNSFYYRNNLTAWFNFSDNVILHRYNISIDGTNIQGNNSIDVASKNVSFSYNISSLSVGQHQLRLVVSDGHTASALKSSYDFSNGLFNDYAKYEFRYPYSPGSITISQKDSSVFDSWTTEQKTDRYSFIFEPSKLAESYTFVVEATGKIDIVDAPNTPYKRWIIYDNHWLDLSPYSDITITRVRENIVEITISKVDPKQERFIFNSIGDLNIVEVNYTFYTTNASVTYPNPVLQLETQTINLYVNTTGSITTSATLYWNGTSKTSTKTSYTGYDKYSTSFTTPSFPSTTDVWFRWEYNFSTSVNSEAGNITLNQTVSNIGIDNCSTFTTRGINFTVYNSTSLTVLNSTSDGNLGIYLSSSVSMAKYFNLTWKNVSELVHGLCISPVTAAFNLTGQMEFFIGSVTKTYYFINSTISNSTQNIDIFYDDGSTLVTFTVVDENSNVVKDAYITILKYDFATNTYKTSEIIKTDSAGQAVGNIVLTTQWYKFIVTKDSVVYLETSPAKILTTSYTLQIVLGSDYFADYSKLGTISCDVSFNNNTACFTYTAIDSTGSSHNYCLNVWKKTLHTNSIINSSCTTAASVTINQCIGEATGDNTYVGIGNVYIGGTEFLCDSIDHSYDTGYKKYGGEGIFATFLIVLCLVMVGIYSPIIAVLLMVLAIVFSVMMGIFALTWSILVGFIILAAITMYRMNKQ